MRDFYEWFRSLRFYRLPDGQWVYADRKGWIPGSARTRATGVLKAIRVYLS